jgi:orotate phosphoribosyltransferase
MPPETDLASRVREAALLEGDFVLSSGKRSNLYVDKYLFSTDPALLRDLAAAIAERLPENASALAGVELGAVPLVTATALRTGLPYVIVRKTAKEHGPSAGESLEGRSVRGERVVLIEDVITTGRQAVEAAGKLAVAGAEVIGIVAVLDRRQPQERDLDGFPFAALLRMEELRVARED